MQSEDRWAKWRQEVAEVALNAVSGAKTSQQFLKHSVRVLFSTQPSVILQKVLFKVLCTRRCPPETSGNDWVVMLLQVDPELMSVEACQAFSVLQLQHALISMRVGWETTMHWLALASENQRQCNVELVLRYMLISASGESADESEELVIDLPPFCPGFRFDWDVDLNLKVSGAVRPEVLVRYPHIWTHVLAAASLHHLPHLLPPLHATLQGISDQLATSTLTLQQMLGMAPLDRWRATALADLLQAAANPVGRDHLEDIFSKVPSGNG